MFCEIVAVLLFVNVSNTLYYLEPRIEVLNPGGFRISIEDSPGISGVRFYGNINKELDIHELTDFSGNMQAVGRRWMINAELVLKIGDVLNYAVVVTKNRLGYRIDDQVYLCTDDQASTTEGAETYNICSKKDESQVVATTRSPKSDIGSDKHFLVNCSQTLAAVQSKIESLNKINQQLMNIMDKYPEVKILTLSGRIPSDDDALKTVSFILREKLDLNPDITTAVRNNENSIEFKVATLLEKLEILEATKEKLKHSRIFIS